MKKGSRIYRFTFSAIIGLLFLFSACCRTASAKPGDAYSADKAVAYADSCFKKSGNSYKKNPNKTYGEELCAGYVSQCLKEGGMTMDSTWYWKAKGDTSEAWRVSKQLFSYLKKSGYTITYSPSASKIKKGDVIFYWCNGGWGHVAICVGKTSDGTPMVNAYNDPHYHFTYWTMGYKTCLVSMDSKTATPEISESVVQGGKEISISCETSNATIYYTTNGKKPTKSSKKYTDSFKLTSNAQVKAIATYSTYKNSSVATESIDVKKVISDGTYYLQTTYDKNMTLGVNNSSKQELKTLSLMSPNTEYNRKFSVAYKGNGSYTLTLLHSGYALSETLQADEANIYADILSLASKQATLKTTGTQAEVSLATPSLQETLTNAGKGKPANITIGAVSQRKPSSDLTQQWDVTYLQKDSYYITNKKSSDYLSVGNNIKTGITAYTTSQKENSGQTWNLKSTTLSKLALSKFSASGLANIKKFTLNGSITSNYKIQSVKVNILNASGKSVVSASASPNSKTFSLEELNTKINFEALSSGTYTFQIKAYDTSKVTKTLFEQKFVIK